MAKPAPPKAAPKPATVQSVAFVSLGCPKNLVDSERMLGLLAQDGLAITSDASEADAIVVNTCGFLEASKTESLEAIREAIRLKKEGRCKRVVVAGCLVAEGSVKRNNPIRVLRDSVVIFEGALESLRRFKDDVNEVRAGTECGIGVKNYQDVRVGDQIECYSRVEVARSIQ